MDDDVLKRDPWEKVKRGLRLCEANRRLEQSARTLDELVDAQHEARLVWEYCLSLDLSALYEPLRAREGGVGRPPYDPLVLFALWLYATLRGVRSALELMERCRSDRAFEWLAGGLQPSDRVLGQFRTRHLTALRSLLIQSVAVLRHAGVAVELEEVAQDGMRVRAHAGAASFRSAATLAEHLELAQELVDATRGDAEYDPLSASRRHHSARQRAARERLERVQQAIAQLPEAARLLESSQPSPARDAKPESHGHSAGDEPPDEPDDTGAMGPAGSETQAPAKRAKPPRRSTTDPDARVMKMGDGGFRPAYNFEFAVDTYSLVVVGVQVTTSGSDMGQMLAMYEDIRANYEEIPLDYLVDGGFVKHSDIEALDALGTAVLAPVRKAKGDLDPHLPKPADSPAIAAWRQRMADPIAKQQYKNRAASTELVNAQARNHGLRLLLVNGLHKVTAIALWHAITHNMTRFFDLARPLHST